MLNDVKTNLTFFKSVRLSNRVNQNIEIKKVLILNNFYDMYAYDDIVKTQFIQLYLFIHLFNQAKIYVYDEDFFNYERLLKNDKLIESIEFVKKEEDINLSDYQLIVTNVKTEIELANNFSKNYFETLESSGISPLIYCLPDTIGNNSSQIESIKNYLKIKSSHIAKTEIQFLKKDLSKRLAPVSRKEEENFYSEILAKIKVSNEFNKKKHYNNVLVLDDFNRKFYLGDSLFWLKNIRKSIEKLSTNGQIIIICNYEYRYRKIKEIYNDSFSHNVKIELAHWNKLKFQEFDLIICHTDLVGKLFNYLKKSNIIESLLNQTSIYFMNMDDEDKCDKYGWSYLKLIDNNNFNFFKSDYRSIKNQVYNEVVVKEEMLLFGENWLVERRVETNDNLIVISNNSSTDNKVLPFSVLTKFILSILQTSSLKIIIFDFKSEGIKGNIVAEIGLKYETRIIVISCLSLRQELGIVSNSRIKSIIGPCTGIMHLINGAYTYIRNNNLRTKEYLPDIFVYTGKGMTEKYHPLNWWKNTMVQVIVFCAKDNKKHLTFLKNCPMGVEKYQEIALSVNGIPSQLIIDFFKKQLFTDSLY